MGYPPGSAPRVYSLHLDLLGWNRARRSSFRFPRQLPSLPWLLVLVTAVSCHTWASPGFHTLSLASRASDLVLVALRAPI